MGPLANHVSGGRSAELRIVVAAAVATVALALAVLAVAAERSRLLMLDFRQWRPSSSVPALSGQLVHEYFDRLQTPVPEQRPLRLSLQVPPTARPGDFVAAEWETPADPRHRYCFQALTFQSPAKPGTLATGALAFARLLINGEEVSDVPLAAGGPGGILDAPGIAPRNGRVRIRFEVRAEALPAGAPQQAPAAVHLEYASLRSCDP